MSVDVSFLCPTFGRAVRQPHVINDAVWGFMMQDYPPARRELVILNDAPGQKLYTRLPGVRIHNSDERFPSLGEKMNALVNLARGKYCVVCEDDDFSLPRRASQAVKMLLDHSDYWRPGLRFYHQNGQMPVPDAKGCSHHASCFRRDRFVDAYADISKGHDQAIEAWAMEHVRVNPHLISDPRLITMVYRWGWSDYHLSAQPDMERGYGNADPGPDGRYEVRAEPGDFDYIDWFDQVYGY